MNALEAIAMIAEGKILEAQAEGLFEHLPGAGKPLALEDLSLLPPEARMAHTILKNSGFADSWQTAPPAPAGEINRTLAPGLVQRRLRRLDFLLRLVRRNRGEDQTDGALAALPESPYLPQLLKRLADPPQAEKAAAPRENAETLFSS
ncbi:MAG: DUF1992 domain-containing protein [Deltaproteobacteria bacterium]|jgi:hypothetical protein|nr:DUF1992 domain-containing protein [Deltaproteobacteria bacterium]